MSNIQSMPMVLAPVARPRPQCRWPVARLRSQCRCFSHRCNGGTGEPKVLEIPGANTEILGAKLLGAKIVGAKTASATIKAGAMSLNLVNNRRT
jgi:hypothetical protein